jgi:hypothetical protein
MTRSIAVYCLLAVLLPCSAHAAECEDIVIQRAGFSAAIEQREPGPLLASLPEEIDRLFYFVELTGAAGHDIIHHWIHNNETVAEVRLPVAGDRWRTWSAKYTGLRRDGRWRVEVRLDSGCLLAAESLTRRPVTLTSIRSLLDQGDAVGAKVAIDEALEGTHTDSALAARLRELRDQDLVLLRIRQAIEAQRLYVAGARLNALSDQGLNPDNRAALSSLKERYEKEKARLESDSRSRLAAMAETLNRTLLGASNCPPSPEQIRTWLSLAGLQDSLTPVSSGRSGDQLELGWLDQRTGTMHSVSLSCPRFFPVKDG